MQETLPICFRLDNSSDKKALDGVGGAEFLLGDLNVLVAGGGAGGRAGVPSERGGGRGEAGGGHLRFRIDVVFEFPFAIICSIFASRPSNHANCTVWSFRNFGKHARTARS